MRNHGLPGIIAVGVGAIMGAIIGLPFLVMKNSAGLLGPILGAICGGLAHRLSAPKIPVTLDNPKDPKDTERRSSHTPPILIGMAFLILGPIIAGAFGYFLFDDPFDTPLMFLGFVVGCTGCVGSLFICE